MGRKAKVKVAAKKQGKEKKENRQRRWSEANQPYKEFDLDLKPDRFVESHEKLFSSIEALLAEIAEDEMRPLQKKDRKPTEVNGKKYTATSGAFLVRVLSPDGDASKTITLLIGLKDLYLQGFHVGSVWFLLSDCAVPIPPSSQVNFAKTEVTTDCGRKYSFKAGVYILPWGRSYIRMDNGRGRMQPFKFGAFGDAHGRLSQAPQTVANKNDESLQRDIAFYIIGICESARFWAVGHWVVVNTTDPLICTAVYLPPVLDGMCGDWATDSRLCYGSSPPKWVRIVKRDADLHEKLREEMVYEKEIKPKKPAARGCPDGKEGGAVPMAGKAVRPAASRHPTPAAAFDVSHMPPQPLLLGGSPRGQLHPYSRPADDLFTAAEMSATDADQVVLFGSFTEDETKLFQGQPVADTKSEEKAELPEIQFTAGHVKNVKKAKAIVPSARHANNVKKTEATAPSPESLSNVKKIEFVVPSGEQGLHHDEIKCKQRSGSDMQVTENGSTGVDASTIAAPVDESVKGGYENDDLLLHGLKNTGNICFLNATLQAFFSCSPFVQLIQDIRNGGLPKVGYPTLSAFVELISQFDVLDKSRMEKKEKVGIMSAKVINPCMFDQVLRNFTPDVPAGASARPRQEDAQEFLSFAMDRMHEELLKLNVSGSNLKEGMVVSASDDVPWNTVGKKNKVIMRTRNFVPSGVSAIFGGQLQSVVKATGNRASASVEPFLLLPLVIYPHSVRTVEDALHLFAAPEHLDEYKTAGKAVAATKSLKIHALPNILVLHLKRFTYGNHGCTKLYKPLYFPLELVLNRDLLSSPSSEGRRYELVATITHHGRSPSSGHYTADAKRAGGQWLRFDDNVVMPINVDKVLHGQAYVLFYKQV